MPREVPGEEEAVLMRREVPGEEEAVLMRREVPGEEEAVLMPRKVPGEEEAALMPREVPGEGAADLMTREIPEGEGNYTYILQCADGTLYTGWTNRLDRRLQAHNRGTGGRYTRVRRPVRLVYYEESGTRQEAMSREWHIKRLSREEKIKLILSVQNGDQDSPGVG